MPPDEPTPSQQLCASDALQRAANYTSDLLLALPSCAAREQLAEQVHAMQVVSDWLAERALGR
jgi:hypothetical protein